MRANRNGHTKPEVELRSELHCRGFRFRKGLPVEAGYVKVRPDVVFVRVRVAVFVDGCFWHSCPDHGTTPDINREYWLPKLRRNVSRDRLVDEALSSAGWTVIRIWEHEVRSDLNGAATKVVAVVTM